MPARTQNGDGGGGHGLEPDVAAPDSNPFATEAALRICLAAEVPGNDPLVQRIAAYLEQTQDGVGDWHFSPGVCEHDLKEVAAHMDLLYTVRDGTS